MLDQKIYIEFYFQINSIQNHPNRNSITSKPKSILIRINSISVHPNTHQMLLSSCLHRHYTLNPPPLPLQSKYRKLCCAICLYFNNFYTYGCDQVNDDLCKENLQLAGKLWNSFYCHAAIRWLAAS